MYEIYETVVGGALFLWFVWIAWKILKMFLDG